MWCMTRAMFFVTALMIGILFGSNGQTTDQETWPEERGLIVTTLNRYGWRTPVQLRHLPVLPGHENYSGTVPGVTFSNRNIHFVSIDVDYRTKCIYMYEYHLRTIVVGTNFSKDLTDMKFQNIHVGVSRGNIQVAVDWLSHTVYWSDSKFRWIVAAPGESDKIDMDYYKIVVDTHLEAPDGLTIDPLEGLLFWSDNGKHPKIERSDLKGENRHTIVSKHLQSPLTLEADIFDKRIYWIDSLSESILSSTYDGNDVITIQKIPNSGLFDLAIFRDVVYISDIQSGYIYTLNTTKGIHLGKQESTIIKIFPEIFYGLAVYSEDKQPLKEKDYCAEKNCDHMCISSQTGAECVCSEGFELDVNTGKCKETFEGYHKAIVVANKTHICLTDIRSFAQADQEYDCRFTVETQYSFTDSPSKFKRKKRQTFLSTPPVGITEDLLSSTARQVTSKPNVASASTQRYTRPRTFSRFSRYTRRRTTPTAWTRPVTRPMLNKTTISPVTQRPSTRVTTNKPVDFIKMFDMEMEKRIFFFATESNTIYRRPIDLPIENDMKEVLVSASGNISGLAYDAEDGDNLYWCESDKGEVWVVNVETKASRIVNRDYSTFVGAHNLVIISNHSMLAMITGSNSYKYIKTLTMDGSRVNTISHGMSTISGLTYDKSEKVLYYINGYYLYKISIITKNTDFVFMSVDDGAFGLILYQNYVAWVHPGDFFVTSYDLVTGSRTRNGYLGNTSMEIVDMKVLDQRLQSTNYTNPCAFEDGGCSQICITAYVNDVMTPVCECRLGYFLDDDNLTCISNVVDDNFIIAVDMTNNELLQISLDDNTITAIPNQDNDQYKGVFFDISTQKVIWTENYDSKMFTSNLNGTEERELADLGYQGYLRRLDKDMTTGNIFFTAFYDDFIGVVTPSGEALVLFSVYTTTSLGDIVVHPGKGVMYYTRDYYFSTYIGRADMDGKNEVELIKGHHVEKPSGVAIDFIHDHLYWSDSHYDTIQQCDLNGINCLTIINMTGTFRDEGIQDIVTDGVYLYYSAYRKDHIVRVDLTPPYERAIVGQSPGMGNLESIAFYSSKNKNKQAVSVACRARGGRGDCSTICLPTMSGRTCACENGAVLKADGRTCNNVFQCTELLQQVVEVNGITKEIDITFSSLCPRHLHDECRYRCPTNFVPLFDTLLTCTNVGWDLESKTLCEESRCPPIIPNGMLDPFCGREIGLPCDFKCNLGFVKAVQKIVCTANGTYQIPDEEICQYVKCPLQVHNGEIIGECSLRIGEECSYQCNNGYRATLSQRKLKCTSDGHWDIADIACSEQVCSGVIGFGKLSAECNMTIGEKCDYTCFDGYITTREKAICTANGTFHSPENGLCTPFKCSDKIENGELDKECSRTLGQACSFSCNKYFTPVVKERKAVCSHDGWSPSASTLCIESVCRNRTLANGNIMGSCNGKVGEKCMVQCNQGFANTTDEAVCLNDLSWHPKDVCQAFTCPNDIKNGMLEKGCNKTIGSSCKYSCDTYYTPSVPNMQITCQATGWDPVSSELCIDSACDTERIPNGKITGNCRGKIGETCRFECDRNFVNITDVSVCQNDRKWSPAEPCTDFKCNDEIENGKLDPDCTATVGTSCKYTCNKFYTPQTPDSTITCQSNGWNLKSSELCKESVCEDTFEHGTIKGTCTKTIGEVCQYNCDDGYVNTTVMTVCKSDKMWHPRNPCTIIKCPASISNGAISVDCPRTVGTKCSYICNADYISNNLHPGIMCGNNGQWDVSDILCLESECKDSSFPNGRVDGKCKKNVGETCAFKCNVGYVNVTSAVVCRNDYMWHPIPSCLPLRCKPYIQNGEIVGSCDLSIGETCNFTCFDGFTPTDLLSSITCNTDGHWNVTKDLCLGAANIATVTSSQTGLPTAGVAAGIAFLLVVILMFIGAFIFIMRRRKFNPHKAKLKTSISRHRRNLEFENPGYSKNADLSSVQTTDVDLDDHVQQVATDNINPSNNIKGEVEEEQGEEYINPSFDNEPLPDVAQIELTNDTTILTTDSWLKEREKNQSDRY